MLCNSFLQAAASVSADGDLLHGIIHRRGGALFQQRHGEGYAAHPAEEHEQSDDIGGKAAERLGDPGGHAHGADGGHGLEHGVQRVQGLPGAEDDGCDQGKIDIEKQTCKPETPAIKTKKMKKIPDAAYNQYLNSTESQKIRQSSLAAIREILKNDEW